MKKLLFFMLTFLLVGCGSKQGEVSSGEAKKMGNMTDRELMAYMMRNAEPDSVAGFLLQAALDHVQGVKIDTLANAYLYTLDNYKGEDADKFAIAFETKRAELQLADNMRMQFRLNLADTLQVGYSLGLEYVGTIRRKGLKAKDIDKEIADFRKACDEYTFRRFVKGFKLGLEEDKGKDFPADIYKRYINMWPEFAMDSAGVVAPAPEIPAEEIMADPEATM